jgi:hypothetical protein
MKKIEWNTGRYYGTDGQPIIAKCIGEIGWNRRIFFHDKNRMITGEIDFPESCIFNEESIMRAYDNGNYSWISENEFNKIG